MRTTIAIIAASLLPASLALAQAPSWSDEQMEVWEFVEQSWVDDVAENGKWPREYVHDRAVSWGTSWPFSQNKASWIEWTRFGDDASNTLIYELSPNAIAVVGDTAVVHYTVVLVAENDDDEREREVLGIVETLVRDDGAWLYLSSVDLEFDFGDD